MLQVAEVAEPAPGAGQVLVRMKAAGVNPVDTYIRAGKYARLPELPYTPGADGAGVIEAAGEGVKGWAKGERVYVVGAPVGTYAEAALCQPENLRRLPDKISFEQGAAIGVPFGTAFRGLFQRGQGRAGETVLVHGASGGVGTAAVQLAKAAGMSVFGTAGSAEGVHLVRQLGADAAFNHREPFYLDRIKEASKGIDLILEMLANQNLAHDLTLLAKQGRVVIIGSRGPVEIDPRNTMLRDADIRGMMLGNASLRELAEIYGRITEQMAAGKISPVIGKTFPLDEAAKAHEQIMKSGALGKVILQM